MNFRVKPYYRARHKSGEMNKDEARYNEELKIKKQAGEILYYYFEKVKFRLAEKMFYTPDFLVVHPGHLEIIEVKGYLEGDALVKWKMAAELYPWLVWKIIRWEKKQWKVLYER
ncbi:MAG: DUF1064 domain-containing protein [Nanoarchaeota archaeon]|nr:DUF1064 domain-containing protein [Nanoarchaeota archaeon]